MVEKIDHSVEIRSKSPDDNLATEHDEKEMRNSKDNTLHFQNTRYEAPRDLRGKTISIRYSRFNDGPERPPIAYYEDERLGTLDPVDFVANDRWAHIDDDNF